MVRTLILSFMLFISAAAYSQKQKEIYYEKKFASFMNGDTEVVLNDLSRVDVVTDSFAVEVDFADKWAEGVGQSLYYALMLDKKAGVLLVVDGDKQKKQIKRLMTLAFKYDITVWIMDYNTDKIYRCLKF